MRRLAAPSLTVLALAFGLWAGGPESAAAQGRRAADNAPLLLTSDEMTSDEELGVVTASGNVEIAHAGRILRADTLTFNRRTNVVTASGNVSIVEASGEVAFAEYVELTSDLRDGVMRNIRTLLADQSRFAAVTARRADGSRTVMRRATYSPCEPCEKDPTRAPIWQLRASRITHDAEQKEVVYDDAWVEIAGVPVFYTPYLSHPDGTEKRKSGFLIPEVSTSSRLGTMIVMPYFQTLGPSSDITLMPAFLSDDNPLLMGEYRQRFSNGTLRTQASWINATETRGLNGVPSNRGNLFVDGQFDLDDTWRWGVLAQRTSDKTFLDRYRMHQRFQLTRQDSNESRLFVEGFQDRGYAAMEAFAFQSLRPEDSWSTSPLVAPALRYSYVGTPQSQGAYWTFDASSVAISRSQGVNNRRGTAIAGWHLPHTTSDGSIYRLSATLQSDVFHTSSLDSTALSSNFRPAETGVNSRALPQVGLEWRRPVARTDGAFRTVLEPIMAGYLAPNIGSQRDFPNEDSRTITFDDTNLFRMNRFPGADRLESGARFVYGLNTSMTRVAGGRVSVMVGQQLRAAEDRALPVASGANTTTSDYVGRVLVLPHALTALSYRFQADDRTGRFLRQATGFSIGPKALQFSTTYVEVDRALQPTALQSIRQWNNYLAVRYDENWSFTGVTAQSLLSTDPGLLYAGLSTVYEDECFLFGIDFLRRNIGRADVPADTTLFFRFGLRSLSTFNVRGL